MPSGGEWGRICFVLVSACWVLAHFSCEWRLHGQVFNLVSYCETKNVRDVLFGLRLSRAKNIKRVIRVCRVVLLVSLRGLRTDTYTRKLQHVIHLRPPTPFLSIFLRCPFHDIMRQPRTSFGLLKTLPTRILPTKIVGETLINAFCQRGGIDGNLDSRRPACSMQPLVQSTLFS